MTRDELINKCRYYKGESVCPDRLQSEDKEHIWFYERRWVNMALSEDPILGDYLYQYNMKGYSNFSDNDGVPKSLKAFLLVNFYKLDEEIPPFSYDVKFIKWYIYMYIR